MPKVTEKKSPPASPVRPLVCTLSGLLQSFSAPEILGIIHDSKKSGQLQVKDEPVDKSIFLRDGEVIFAASNQREDRLGESLVRNGRITPQQLDKASQVLAKRQPGVRLGKILVTQGALSPGKLWVGVKNQVEEIFFSVLKMNQGQFYFLEGEPPSGNVVRLSRSVRALIYEGVRKLEEFKIFVEKIISHQTVFVSLRRPSDLKLNDVETQIYFLIDGKRKVREILTLSELSPFATLKVLSNLMLARVIVPSDLVAKATKSETPKKPAKPGDRSAKSAPQVDFEMRPAEEETTVELPDEEKVLTESELLRRYNRIFAEVNRIMEDAGLSLAHELKDYFADIESPFAVLLFQLEWQREGGLDEATVLGRLAHMDPTGRLDLMNRALEDMLTFLLFKSQEFLPKEFSESLMGSIRELQEE